MPIKSLVALASVIILSSFGAKAAADLETITVPVRFHIVTDMIMVKDGLEMQSWASQDDIENTILPEVNRIWRPAGIQFEVETIIEHDALDPPNKQELIDYIVESHRNSEGRSDPERITKLNELINWDLHGDDVINVYLVPYLGETSQGNARRRIKRAFVTQYSDKASRAKQPPKKFQLTEPLPFKEGSLSRTVAHEIGHIFRLGHPDRKTQTVFGMLMGGRKSGYDLTQENIETAREAAIKIADHRAP